MAYSYHEILTRMENTYYQLTGQEASECSDTGIRLKLLAGEIYSMGTYANWLKKQMFFTTASGEQLDYHAAQRGLTRKRGEKARGIVVFRTNVAMEYDLVIPEGTICSTADGALNYATEEDVTIQSGNDYTYVPVSAVNTGTAYNVSSRTVNTLVTYFSVGITIENSSRFFGGTDDESDEELRQRIADAYRFIANGANEKYYQTVAESVTDVYSAYVYAGTPSTRTINVIIGGKGSACSAATVSRVSQALEEKKCAGVEINVTAATLVGYPVSVQIAVKDGYQPGTVKANVSQAIAEYFHTMRVHQDVLVAEIGRAILNVDGVKNYTFSNMSDRTTSPTELAVIGNISVGDL